MIVHDLFSANLEMLIQKESSMSCPDREAIEETVIVIFFALRQMQVN